MKHIKSLMVNLKKEDLLSIRHYVNEKIKNADCEHTNQENKK
jgi:hypothetical protein